MNGKNNRKNCTPNFYIIDILKISCYNGTANEVLLHLNF